MFVEFYGLHEDPFNLFSQRYLYLSVSHRKALSSLQYGIEYGSGVQLLLSDAGLGKTALLRYLEARYQTDNRIIYLASTSAKDPELVKRLAGSANGRDFGNGRVASQASDVIKQSDLQPEQLVLLVDDAHQLNHAELRKIIALATLDGSKRGSLNIILAGRPTLLDNLKQASLPHTLKQIWIAPLDVVETTGYINHRLKMAAGRRGSIFTHAACAVIAKQSEGVPSAINRICVEALLDGAQRERQIIDASVLDTKEPEQVSETEQAEPVMPGFVIDPSLRDRKAHHAPIVVLALLILAGAAAAYWYPESYSVLQPIITTIEGALPANETPPASGVAQSAPSVPAEGIDSGLQTAVQPGNPSASGAAKPSAIPGSVTINPPVPTTPPMTGQRQSGAVSRGSRAISNEDRDTSRITASNTRMRTRETQLRASTPDGLPPSEVKSSEANAEINEAGVKSSEVNTEIDRGSVVASRYGSRRADAHQARVYAQVGDDYMRLGKYDQAIQFYQDALILEPDDGSVKEKIQKALVKAGDEAGDE
jgi:general secretion pathway protein A